MSTPYIARSMVVAGLLLILSANALGGELEQRFDRQLARAKGGDVQAMYAVGELYELGMGTDSNRQQALSWYRAAADKGHPEGAYQVGYAFYWGKGLEKDRRQAHAWFLRAAQAGSQAAMPYLSKMYALGQGVPQDKAEAERWADRAATSSNLRAPPPPAQVTRAPQAEPVVAESAPQEATAPAPKAARQAATPRPRAAAKPRPDPSAGRAQMQLLLASHWLKGSRPALYLPSSETRCHDEDGRIICHSETRRSSLMGRAYGFRIVATLWDFDARGRFSLSYRPEVTGVLQAGPGAYGAGDEAGEAITDDQLRERVERDPHEMSCQLSAERTIKCKDDAGKSFEYSGTEPSTTAQPDAVVFNTPLPGNGQTDDATPPSLLPLPAGPAGFQRIRIADRRP